MGMKEMIERLKNHVNPEPEVYRDDETTDKYLRSLRRERRVQMEEEEKERLQKQIALYKKKQLLRNMYGKMYDEQRKERNSRLIKGKKPIGNVLKDAIKTNNKDSLLKDKSYFRR